ncbi:hypothetical protein [Rubrobacter aplysinae]|uniref:hypothetical protein n=1 Tax=Rubrobacter aplysinae TaxID=909625 RepID=UPI00128D4C2B|nr:hypothetical protein [Rubrobacter aplysinae]
MVTANITENPAAGNTESRTADTRDSERASRRPETNTVSTANFRCKRGIALYKRYAEKIRRSAPHTYLVPSQSGKGIYLVYMKEGEECCSCPDYAKHHEKDEEGNETFFCKHYFAARLWKARSAECAACKGRYLTRHLKEAGEGHLTFYADDYLCGVCVPKHGLGEVA